MRTERIGIKGPAGAAGTPGTDGEPGPTGAAGSGLELTVAGGVLVTGSTSLSTNVDVPVYTVPASPSGAFRCNLSALVLRLATVTTGSATWTITAGTSAGGTDLLTAQTITSGATAGADYGLDIDGLGASFIATKGFNALLAAGATVYVRIATGASGTTTSPPTLRAQAMGFLVP